AGLAAPVVGGLVGYGLGAGFVSLHNDMGSGRPQLSGVYAAAVALAVLACTVAVNRLAMHKRNAVGVEVGALIAWSLIAIAVAVYLPAASFLFAWPLLAATIAAQASKRESLFGGPLHWFAAAVIVAFIVPTAYLMVVAALGLDAIGGAILGVLVAMGATLARPVLVTSSDGWWPTAVLPLVAVWQMVVGVSTVRTSADHPVGASLVFAIDADSGRSFASGSSAGDVGAAWVNKAIGAKPADARDVPSWVRRLIGARPVTKAEPFVSPLPAPRVTVLKDSVVAGARNVMVRIRPGSRNTLGIRLELDSANVQAATVDGRSVGRDRYRRAPTRWTLDFVAPPDSGFTLGLTMDAGGRATLGVSARVAGLV
ncbi:MAG: hypothetical protein AABZ80_03205, partial [Gemmatimonadota bacterium]